MKIIVDKKYSNIFKLFNKEIEEINDIEDTKLAFGYQNIISNNESIMKKITNNYKFEVNKIYVSINYGIGSFNTKNIIVPEVKSDNIRMRLRRNKEVQKEEPCPIISNFVLIYYISIIYNGSSYNSFSKTVPIKYDFMKDINKNIELYDDLKILELLSVNYEEIIFDSCKHCDLLK